MIPDRALYDRAFHPTRLAAFPSGEFVGQESFMRASEILRLARAAGVGPAASVLDVCCGVGGPGRLIASELGCRYLGVDADPPAVELARELSADLGCTFQLLAVPPLPTGPFDVVMLLETMLAFADKNPLLRSVASALTDGGRFACTLEAGPPLSVDERALMPHADTVWPIPLADLVENLERVCLHVQWLADCTRAHLSVVDALIASFTEDRAAIAGVVGPETVDGLLDSHRLWGEWMRRGRIWKVALVAVKMPPGPRGTASA